MKTIKKKLVVIVPIIIAATLLAACGTARTCATCGRSFRGRAYHGFVETTVLSPDCARAYWYPFDISNFRIR